MRLYGTRWQDLDGIAERRRMRYYEAHLTKKGGSDRNACWIVDDVHFVVPHTQTACESVSAQEN